ncbi:hypothetical protein [Acinetobacter junii]|uniref:Uncharacterized protein n=1 Tax=Acinetobacter junii TaxID=40215 RepID=A0AAX1MDT8_ACIJU|nr:hypothetical protein [Acinetobacter junii]QUY35608.1 hypothetical protein H2677_09990 [Acinetobacter junii]
MNKSSSELLAEIQELALNTHNYAMEILSPSKINVINKVKNLQKVISSIHNNFNDFSTLTNNFYEETIKEKLNIILSNLEILKQNLDHNAFDEKILETIRVLEMNIKALEYIYRNDVPILKNFDNHEYYEILLKSINSNLDKNDQILLSFNEFHSLPDKTKINIYKKLILLRNLIVKNVFDHINKDLLIDSINYLISLNENIIEGKKLVENLEETAQNININISEKSNEKILQAFKSEATDLKKNIDNLNYLVFSIFFIIIITLIIKGILAIFFDYAFRDLYNIFIFITIVLSMSGLLTYVIKERTRNVKLYDFYQRRYLELNALPEFISELTPEDRRNLIKELTHTYFNGNQCTTQEISNESKITEISKYTEDLKKMIENIQSITK